jgi:integrase/recombinase XerD
MIAEPLDRTTPTRLEAAWVALDRFLEDLAARGRSPHTRAAYGADLRRLLADLAAGRPSFGWAELTAADVRGYQERLARRYSPASVARKVASARSFCAWLAAAGLVARDPAAGLRPPEKVPWTPRVLTAAELDALLAGPDAVPGPAARRDAAVLRLLRATGARITEVVSLDLTDLDLAAGYVLLAAVDDGATGRERLAPLDAPTVAALHRYVDTARPLLHSRGRRPPDTPALLVNHRGARISRQGVWLRIQRYAARARLEGVSPAALRHSCAVELLRQRTALRDVQSLLGHANPVTTARYARLLAP